MIITLMFALPAVDSQSFASEAQAQTVIVQGSNVRLRYGPGLNYGVHKLLNKGTRLRYVSTSGDWYCVNYNGYNLYVHRDFASISYNNSGKNYGKGGYSYVRINGNGVRLRYGPGLNYGIYKQVGKGAKLRYVATYGDWYCVNYNGYNLYVNRDFASLSR